MSEWDRADEQGKAKGVGIREKCVCEGSEEGGLGGGGVCVSNFRTLKFQLHVGLDNVRVEFF